MRASLLFKLAANFAALFWPSAVDALPPTVAWAGAGLALALAAVAWRAGREGRWIALGSVVALCGLLPALPGPDAMAVAGTRYTYPSAIGVAFLAAGLFELIWRSAPRVARGGARTALVVAFAGWIAVQVASVRSVERWRYERRCDRLASLLEGTRAAVLGAGAAVVVAPDIWNVLDYGCALYVFLDVEPSRVLIEDVPLDSLRERLRPGGDLDPAANALFTSPGDADIARLSSADEAPWGRWEEVAADQAKRDRGGTLPVVRITARR